MTALLQGCSPSREVSVGAVLSLTGEGAYYGQAIRQGMDLAAAQVNASGGIRGSPLRILYRDSASSPEEAMRAATQLYDRHDVPLILGAVLSSETLRIAPLAERRHKILLSPASSSPQITRAGKYVFRVYPSDTLEGAYMAQLAADDLGLGSMVVLAIDNAYGRGLAEVFRKSFRGAVPPAVHLYPAHGADYSSVAEKVPSSRADGVYLAGYYSDMAEILKEIRRVSPSRIVLSTSGFGNPKTLESAGAAAEGVIYPAIVFDPGSEDPTVSRFVAAFRAKYASEPDLWAAHGYDAVLIASEAMARSGGAVPERIAQALLAIRDFHGASGLLSFDSEGDVVQYPRAYIVHEGRFMLYRDYLEDKHRQEEPARP